MFSDDVAEACVFLMMNYEDPGIVNIGTGEEVSILGLAQLIGELTGYKGKIVFDPTKPDGTYRKFLDSSRLHQLGFNHKMALREGIEKTYQDFLSKQTVYTLAK
jgi:GDP-L-fucose synthase